MLLTFYKNARKLCKIINYHSKFFFNNSFPMMTLQIFDYLWFLCSCVLLWHVYHKPIRWIHVVNLTNQMFANITMFKTDEIISRIKFDISPKHFQITFLQFISLKLYQFYYSFTIQSLIWYFDFVLTYFFHCHLFS